MMQSQLYAAAVRAASRNPAFIGAGLFRLARDVEGREDMDTAGRYGFEFLTTAAVSFDTWQPAAFAGITGEYSSDFRVTVLPDPVGFNPLTLPDLSGTLVIRLIRPRQPFPMLSLVKQRIGADAAGITHKFSAKAIDPEELAKLAEP